MTPYLLEASSGQANWNTEVFLGMVEAIETYWIPGAGAEICPEIAFTDSNILSFPKRKLERFVLKTKTML